MTPAQSNRCLEAEELRIVDSQGRLRALLGALSSRDGDPLLTFFDKDGLQRIIVHLDGGLPSACLLAPNGQPLISIAVSDDGASTISVCRDDGTPALLLTARRNLNVKFALCDERGEPLREGGANQEQA